MAKAMRTLMSTKTIAPRNTDTSRALQDLYKEEAPGATPEAPPPTKRVKVTEALVMQAVEKLARGAAPGLDGWTRELVLPLTRNETATKGLATLVEDIVNGCVTTWTRKTLSTVEITPLSKPGNKMAVRPITPESCILKLAGTAMLIKNKEEVRKAIAPQQYGMRDIEKAIHVARGLAEVRHMIALDLTNAYGSIDRAHIMNTLYDHRNLSDFWALAYMTLGEENTAVLMDEDGGIMNVFKSTRGVRQGSVLAPFFFCLAIDHIVRTMEQNAAYYANSHH